jgi:hypothetical protein
MAIVLLTCAVDPRGAPSTIRADPKLRLREYEEAFRWWGKLSQRQGWGVLVVENTGFPIQRLRRCFPDSVPLRFISYEEQQSLSDRGKGVAEAAMFDRVADAIEDDDVIVKVTGRLRVRNAAPIVRGVSSDVSGLFRSDLARFDTRFFVSSGVAFRDIFVGLGDSIVESDGQYLEHATARAVLRSVASGTSFRPLSRIPAWQGVSASTGENYSSLEAQARRQASSLLRSILTDRSWL